MMRRSLTILTIILLLLGAFRFSPALAQSYTGDLTTTGQAIFYNQNAPYVATNAFDNNLATLYQGSGVGDNFIGQDFGGSSPSIRQVTVYRGGVGDNPFTAVFQYSDDGLTYSDTNVSVNINAGTALQTYAVNDFGGHRYWRWKQTSGATYMQVQELEMMALDLPPTDTPTITLTPSNTATFTSTATLTPVPPSATNTLPPVTYTATPTPNGLVDGWLPAGGYEGAGWSWCYAWDDSNYAALMNSGVFTIIEGTYEVSGAPAGDVFLNTDKKMRVRFQIPGYHFNFDFNTPGWDYLKHMYNYHGSIGTQGVTAYDASGGVIQQIWFEAVDGTQSIGWAPAPVYYNNVPITGIAYVDFWAQMSLVEYNDHDYFRVCVNRSPGNPRATFTPSVTFTPSPVTGGNSGAHTFYKTPDNRPRCTFTPAGSLTPTPATPSTRTSTRTRTPSRTPTGGAGAHDPNSPTPRFTSMFKSTSTASPTRIPGDCRDADEVVIDRTPSTTIDFLEPMYDENGQLMKSCIVLIPDYDFDAGAIGAPIISAILSGLGKTPSEFMNGNRFHAEGYQVCVISLKSTVRIMDIDLTWWVNLMISIYLYFALIQGFTVET